MRNAAVEFLYSLFPDVSLKKGENPYQTFYRVKKIRDSLAHNKVLRYSEVTESETPDFKTSWDDFDNPGKVRPVLVEIKALTEAIRVEALKVLKEEYQLSHLHFNAFEGPLAHAEGTTRDSTALSVTSPGGAGAAPATTAGCQGEPRDENA